MLWKQGHVPSGLTSARSHPPKFDTLTSTMHGLQTLLTNGELKSIDLVQEYVWRIEAYNGYLCAVSEYASDVASQAHALDEKRAAGEFLGPLHGIPVLLKVSFY